MRRERRLSWFGCGSETFFFLEADGALVFLQEGGSAEDGDVG